MEYTERYEKREKDGIVYYTSPLFNSLGVVHAFPERHGGVSTGCYASLNLSTSTGDSEENVRENTRRLLAAFGATPASAVKSHQVHQDTIRVVGKAQAGEGLLRPSVPCDGLLTADKAVTLMASSADCPLILLYAPDRQLAEVVHAGWRGTAMDMAGKAVEALVARGADPRALAAFLPPAIGPIAFETDPDVPEAMQAHFAGELQPYIREVAPARYQVDLQGINAHALCRRGMLPERIEVARICTCLNDNFFSHRRDKTKRGLSTALIRIPT